MQLLKYIGLLFVALLVPTLLYAATAVPWNTSNVLNGYISPTAVNGTAQGVLVSASSTVNAPFTLSRLISGLVGSNNGLLYSFASSSLFGFIPSSFSYLFPSNATSTLLTFNGGITVNGTSTLATTTVTSLQIQNWIVATSTTVCMAPEQCQFQAKGTADNVTILAAYNSIPSGIVYIKPGTYSLNAAMTFTHGSTTIQGSGMGITVLKINYDGSGGSQNSIAGALTFYNTATPISAITVKDLTIDHNGFAGNGIHVRTPNATNVATSTDYLFQNLEFKNKLADNTGSIASIKVSSDYNGAGGALDHVTLDNINSHDNLPTSIGAQNNMTVEILSDTLSNFTVKDSFFHNLYGTTMSAVIDATTTAAGWNIFDFDRRRKNWQFLDNTFQNTVIQYVGSSALYQCFNTRDGLDSFKFTGNTVDEPAGKWGEADQVYCLSAFNSHNAIIDHNTFNNVRSVLAPGHSFPTGNETQNFTFSNNTVYQAFQWSDPDGHYAGTYTNNTFYKITWAVFGGYGRHAPTVYQDNFFYDTPLNPQTDIPTHQALFAISDGGNVVQNNSIYFDYPAPTANLWFIFSEISAGGTTTPANIYANNHIYGPFNVASSTFDLDSQFKHVITGNTGVVESTIVNDYTGDVPVNKLPLAASDIATNNWKADGTRVAENRPLEVSNGGTGTTTQITNGINFFDGTNISSSNKLLFSGTLLTVGDGTTGSIKLGDSTFSKATGGYFTLSSGLRLSGADGLTFGGAQINSYTISTDSYLAFDTTGSAERMRLASNGNFGIGTTTPGSLFALGNTGANTINISATATSTFGSGINILTGCFAINGVCVGSGAGTVTSVTGTYPVQSTGGATPAISLAFGTTSSNTWANTQTFTNPIINGSLSGLISGNSGQTYASATSTLTASSPLTGSFTHVGTSGSIGCQTASGSQAGCLSSGDWTIFNAKAGFAYPFIASATTSSLGIYASTTIGDGTQVGGLTISGGATTSGQMVIQSATSPSVKVGNGTTGSIWLGDALWVSKTSGSYTNFNGNGIVNTAGLAINSSATNIHQAFLDIPTGTGDIGSIFRGVSGQTADLTEWQDTNSRILSLVNSNGWLGVASSSPFAKLSIHANPTDSTLVTTLFAIGSSTASATTTLFSVNNVGTTTLGLFGACSTTKALTTDASGNITCGAITGTASPFSFTPFTSYNATTTAIGFTTGGMFTNGSTTVTSVGTGLVGANGGLLYGFASSSLFGFTPTPFAWTPTTNFGVNTNATSTTLSLTAGLNASSTVRIGTTGTTSLTFNSQLGALGIGTTSPYAMLTLFTASTTGSTVVPTTLFAISSSTASGATTTLLSVDNQGQMVITENNPIGNNVGITVQGIAQNAIMTFQNTTGEQLQFKAQDTKVRLVPCSVASCANDGTLFIDGDNSGTNIATFLGSATSPKEGIATTTPTATLGVHGTIMAKLTTFASGDNAVCQRNAGGFLTFNSGVTSCAVSSKYTKDYIQDDTYDGAWSRIEKVRVIEFKYKDSGKADIGAYAEDMAMIDPRYAQYTTVPRDMNSHHYEVGDAVAINWTAVQADMIVVMQHQVSNTIVGAARSAEENWQDGLIALLIIGFGMQQWQIRKLKK